MAEDSLKLGSHPAAGSSAGTVTAAASPGAATASGGVVSGVVGVRSIAAPNLNTLGAPPIVTRQQWGADEAIRLNTRAYAPIRKLVVHHTASTNKPSSPASVVRFVQKYHTVGRGFSDTGYNYLIDHKGVIYEGRAARNYGAKEAITDEDNKGWGVVGAHAKGVNAGSCGICLIGDFDAGSPTDAAVASLVWLLAWKAGRHRIDPTGSDEYIDIYGGHRTFPNIAGHRQVGNTACPGKRLYGLLPTLRQEVARRIGHFDALTVDMPYLLRTESGQLRASDPSQLMSGSGSSSGAAPTGTKLTGVRVVSSAGQVFTAGKAGKYGNPSASGISKAVAIANTQVGDGYWVLASDGKVVGFGGVGTFGDAAGKGTAADIAVTGTGKGYWILMADGGIYPFGDAGYASSPKKAGLGGTSLKIVARPQADGYWVLMADNTIRAFGAAPKLGAPTDGSTAVDFWPTPSGAGYWVLTSAGSVVCFGDAPDKGDVKRSKIKWSKHPPAHIVGTRSGAGYVIVNNEGSMLAFGDASLYPSFGGSGMSATGAAPAFT